MVATTQIMAGTTLDETYAQISSGGTTSFLRDGLNSTDALTNSSGAITRSDLYSPYGDSAGSGAGSSAFQYTGRENDGATGLYYYRARHYAPQLGRFISEDPIGLGGGTNLYAYVNGDPISKVDPSGNFDIVGAAIGVGWELASQLYEHDGNGKCINVGRVAVAGLLGLFLPDGFDVTEYALGVEDAILTGFTKKEVAAVTLPGKAIEMDLKLFPAPHSSTCGCGSE